MEKKTIWIIIIIVLILVGIGIYIAIESGAFKRALDPCEKQFEECNHACGEGILSSICKEKCTFDYKGCEAS